MVSIFFIFHNIWDVILPMDELIFVKIVKTTNQIYMINSLMIGSTMCMVEFDG